MTRVKPWSFQILAGASGCGLGRDVKKQKVKR